MGSFSPASFWPAASCFSFMGAGKESMRARISTSRNWLAASRTERSGLILCVVRQSWICPTVVFHCSSVRCSGWQTPCIQGCTLASFPAWMRISRKIERWLVRAVRHSSGSTLSCRPLVGAVHWVRPSCSWGRGRQGGVFVLLLRGRVSFLRLSRISIG